MPFVRRGANIEGCAWTIEVRDTDERLLIGNSGLASLARVAYFVYRRASLREIKLRVMLLFIYSLFCEEESERK